MLKSTTSIMYRFFCQLFKVRSRRLSEPVSPIQTELPPAIPAMLSKAKGLLKKKLKPSSEGPSPLSSPTPPAEEETMDNVEEESQKIKCPPEVQELIECSAKTRCVVIC